MLKLAESTSRLQRLIRRDPTGHVHDVDIARTFLSRKPALWGVDERIVNLINLKILALYENELTGVIPHDIWKLSIVEQLLLHINKLTAPFCHHSQTVQDSRY